MEEDVKTLLKNEFFKSFKPSYYEYCNNLIKLLGFETWEDILPPEKYDEKMIK